MPRLEQTRTATRLLRLLACCVAAAFVWACGPVYIPVPPPNATTFTKDLVTDPAGGAWIAAGGPEERAADALFYIFDEQQNAGVIAGAAADGSYLAPSMRGTEGDHVVVHYQDPHGDISPSICLILSELRPPLVCQ